MKKHYFIQSFWLILTILCINLSFSQGATCATATPLTINGACGSGLITDGTQNNPAISGCSPSNFRREGWYTFTVSGGPLNVTITASAADKGLYLQLISSTASCTGLSEVTCQNADGANNSAQTETISTNLSNGIYYIKVVNEGNNGDMTLNSICLTAVSAPTNDNCNNATPLTITSSCSYTTYTNVGATASTSPSTPPAPGCGNYSGGDVWFSFIVPANGTVTVDTQTGGITDSGMAWYSGSCGSLTLIECDDDDSANGYMSSITRSGLTPGSTIYVRFWEYGNDNQGTFGICATSPLPCTSPLTQANNFTTGAITSSSFPASFNGSADGYLVIRSLTSTPPTQPTNGTIYNSGNINTLGTGLTFVQSNTSTSIAGTGLNGNTQYYYFIYSYNNSGCSGGPIYNNLGPLTGNGTTCPIPPATVSTSSTVSSIDFSWSSSIGGGANAVSYELQVTYDSGYTINVPGSPFTINDPTTSKSVTGLASNTSFYYRLRANNGCYSSYKSGTAVTGYCLAQNTTNTSYYISGVSTSGGVSNFSNTPTGFTAGGYADYTASYSVSQNSGTGFSITATHPSSTYGYSVWVDWNNDLDFDDPGENVINTGYLSSPASLGTVTIPASTPAGNYRMRIRNAYLSNPAPSCGDFQYGEAEDYTINCLGPLPCSGNPTSIIANVTSQTDVDISWTAASPDPTNGYQYYISSSATPTPNSGTTPTGSVGAGITTTTINGLTPGNTYYIWIRSNCGGGLGQGVWGTYVQFIMPTCSVGNSQGTTTLGCPSVISGGLSLNGADPSPVSCSAASTCVDLEATYLNLGDTSTYTVESIPYNPPYQFTCLKNPVSVNVDDIWSPVINLPFDFCFYGNTYNQCLIGSNGVITFDITNNLPGDYCDWSFSANLPVSSDASLVENSIFGVFHDIDPSVGGEVGWELITLDTGCRALVASWSDVPMYDENSILYTGMMVLYENTNVIEVYIQEKNIDNFGAGTWNDGNAVVGIQNADGTIATVAPNRNGLDANWAVTNEAWRFIPSGSSITSIKWYEGSGNTGPVVGTTDQISVCPTATTVYTAEVTYTLCGGATLKELDETTVTINGGKIWTGAIDSNWNDNNNWSPTGIPTASDCVIIPVTANNPIISGTSYDAVGLNLTIQNGADLTLNPTNNLTITNWINNNTTGNLILENSASLIQINNNTNIGSMDMTREVDVKLYDYVYWSSPVADYAVNNINGSYRFKWEPTIPSTYTSDFGNWVGANENMVAGKGYIVRTPNTFNTSLQAFSTTFTGTPNNGDITIPISRSTYDGPNYTGPTTTPITKDDDNWNLLGNPYPSAINAIDFLTLNTNIDGFIKVWTHGNLPSSAVADPFYDTYTYNYSLSDYITYNASGSSSGPGVFGGYIGAAQGFFVLMNHAGTTSNETVTFNNTMRSSTYDNSQFFRTNTNEEKNRIWLDLASENGTVSRTLIGYFSNATNAIDRLYDAKAPDKNNFDIYSINSNQKFNIQGRELPFDDSDRIPIGINILQNGNHSIGIGALDGLFNETNQAIYLEDLENGIIHDLRVAPYSFTSTIGAIDNRFVLRFNNNTLNETNLASTNDDIIVTSNENLNIKSLKSTIDSITIYDVLGRNLGIFENINATEKTIFNLQKNKAPIFIKIKLNNGSLITKKAIH
ncbi:GEVED domain-containing protein [Flavobacterium sp. J27]|uniref:GEVED domain-containing protein n=1 Tax=Flavobacterium sp. J27 TaxID=2060419 RepID=UPI0010322003|nr:GEVED domain-containing protein [Flavobacterium sp. J27]